MNLNRVSVIQFLINKYNYKNYLEIGVHMGKSFLPIKCKKKIGVDPEFKISINEKRRWLFKNFSNRNNVYFEMKSDDFFLEKRNFFENFGKVDIVLVDGLHTFRATLNDTLNSIKILSGNGVIICHDCFPPHEAAAIIAEDVTAATRKGIRLPDWTGEWCGDSWKCIAYLLKKYPTQLKVQVLDVDYGLGIIKVLENDNLDLKIDEKIFSEIDSLTYTDLVKNHQNLVNLVNKEMYKQI